MKTSRVHVWISGKVQGVSFRESTRAQAVRFGVHGWVKNLSDGRVECVFEGETAAVDKLVDYVRRGPALAVVEHLQTSAEEPEGDLSGFAVLRNH